MRAFAEICTTLSLIQAIANTKDEHDLGDPLSCLSYFVFAQVSRGGVHGWAFEMASSVGGRAGRSTTSGKAPLIQRMSAFSENCTTLSLIQAIANTKDERDLGDPLSCLY